MCFLLQVVGFRNSSNTYVNGTVEFCTVNVQADSEEDAQDDAENYVRVEWDSEGSLDWELEVDRVSEQ